MRTETQATIRLKDYAVPAFLVDSVHLTFSLHPTTTRVTSRIVFRPNPARAAGVHDLVLDGNGQKLIRAGIDDTTLPDDACILDADGLTIPATHLPEGTFAFVCVTEISPSTNTSLEGLYMSNGMYCTQCEAEGFRRITFYPDRPDVMAIFTVRIEGDLPVMLSNGNLLTSEQGVAEWHDPHPKPAYLFALVAGDLVSLDDSFTTMSGREVTLRIFVRSGDEGRCAYAMDALKRSMRWDEETYGREYDLDLFMIVAVDDFNAGAMENKGLNVFNSKYVLASPETATDRDYALIEGIIAHEYFHNWTGNRITCRDWFQLSLKEGLTVFRDQQFSADMRSAAVQRISDVQALRSRQFREDSGPLAHPVRPAEYVEINNFYTATVYEKGAEVIRMLHAIVGQEAYDQALSLYFDRHDGQACTIEDWLKVFEDTTGRDLGHFARWYAQAGTPRVDVSESYRDGHYTLTFTQSTPPTPGQDDKMPLVIPVAYGFLDGHGNEIGEAGVLELTRETESWVFDLPEQPVASLLRGFSAPVILNRDMGAGDYALLLAHDSDPFCRWEAGHKFAMSELVALATGDAAPSPAFLTAMHSLALDQSADPAFRALVLSLPSVDEICAAIAELGKVPDPDRVFGARKRLNRAIAAAIGDDLQKLYDETAVPGAYSPDAVAAGQRALRGRILDFLTSLDPDARVASAQFDTADNMTEKLSALGILVSAGRGDAALSTFHDAWRHDPNVLDKWFSIQTANAAPDTALDTARELSRHPDFTWKTPNRFRALLGGLAMQNTAGFHRHDGAGYEFIADWILKMDAINPSVAARTLTVFDSWRRYDDNRQAHAKRALDRIAAATELSKDSTEMVTRIIKA